MKIQIRRGVFETNSSSVHSITMMMKTDYEQMKTENHYTYEGDGCGWTKREAPENETIYTKDEVIEFIKKNRFYEYADVMDDDTFDKFDFISSDEWSHLESYYEEFITPSGETVVAFGQYGYDG